MIVRCRCRSRRGVDVVACVVGHLDEDGGDDHEDADGDPEKEREYHHACAGVAVVALV